MATISALDRKRSASSERNLNPAAATMTHYPINGGDVICNIEGKFRFTAAFNAAKLLVPTSTSGRVVVRIGSKELVITKSTTLTGAYKAFGGTSDPNNLITR